MYSLGITLGNPAVEPRQSQKWMSHSLHWRIHVKTDIKKASLENSCSLCYSVGWKELRHGRPCYPVSGHILSWVQWKPVALLNALLQIPCVLNFHGIPIYNISRGAEDLSELCSKLNRSTPVSSPSGLWFLKTFAENCCPTQELSKVIVLHRSYQEAWSNMVTTWRPS